MKKEPLKNTDAKPKVSAKKVAKKPGKEMVIVGIGASAGGLEALRILVSNLPVKANMAYVIAQHMSPHHRSMMVELLSRETKLPVFEVKSNMTPQPDTIYVAPPASDVSIKSGNLQLRKPLADLGAKPSIDYLFSTMAEELGERAIGIVMSGTGTDGSHGIRAINSAGGISIAQAPETAKYDSMPVAAIKAGADIVLSPEEIATKLIAINARPRVEVPEFSSSVKTDTPTNLIKLIYQHTKMDFSNYKEATIIRQIERRMAILQINDLNKYLEIAEANTGELKALANNFLICVTSFFRDNEPFKLFREEIKFILQNKKEGDNIRIWVPGCATGEEAYTIAIIIAEELSVKLENFKVQIFATDANPETTQFGRRGLYPETSIECVPPELLKKYFVQKDRFFQVDRKIKDLVIFATQDLVQDPPFVRLDAISCRNLLIYFKSGLQDKVFRTFHYALNPDGILLLGKSESVGQNSELFLELNRKQKLFKKNNIASLLPDSSFAGAPHISIRNNFPTAETIHTKNLPVQTGQEALFDAYAPPSILITDNGDILHIYGDITPFTQIKQGKPDFNLFSIVHSSLRTELRAIVQKVARNKTLTYTHPAPIPIDSEEKIFRICVRNIKDDSSQKNLLLLSFENIPARIPNTLDLESLDDSAEATISELSHELTITKENLQTVIEELETSNEELQSLNEEAQAANEELQASNEELETSNEELQATNEELTTVNDELSTKTSQLIEALNDMEIIQNSTESAIIVVDQDLNIRRYNNESLKFFKIDFALNLSNLSSIPVLFKLNGFIDKVNSVNKISSPYSSEFNMGDNQYEIDIYPYRTEAPGNNQGAIITIQDITERAQAKIEAEKANRSKSEFLASMSHELRTPLNAILGFTQLFKINENDPAKNEQMEYLSLIRNSGEHLLTLINGVLDLAKVEAGSIPISLETVHPWETISTALKLIEETIRNRELAITLQNSAHCPDCKNPCMIVADQNRFRQVLINLLNNAVKYNRKNGQVTLDCARTENHMRFSVHDTGAGIAEHHKHELFQPFQRLGAEGSNIEGTGIGLSISKKFIQLMNGNIDFTSIEGAGSTFWFELPLSHTPQAEVATKPENDKEIEIPDLLVSASGKKILYVEDNTINLHLMEKIFNVRLKELNLLTAPNAEIGLEIAAQEKPDLILMDINLPGISGIEALNQMKKSRSLNKIPVIAISADAIQEDIDRTLKEGFCDYITKPFKVDYIVTALINQLNTMV